jgi:hypothetical protein
MGSLFKQRNYIKKEKENTGLYFSESELDLMHSTATTVNDLSR